MPAKNNKIKRELYCPLGHRDGSDYCLKCSKACFDFTLYIICENPNNLSLALPKIKALLKNQKKVNIIIDSADMTFGKIPSVDPSFEYYCEQKNYNLMIQQDFCKEKYDNTFIDLINCTGGGMIVFGSEPFKNTVYKRFEKLVRNMCSSNEIQNMPRKIAFRFIKDESIPVYVQDSFWQ